MFELSASGGWGGRGARLLWWRWSTAVASAELPRCSFKCITLRVCYSRISETANAEPVNNKSFLCFFPFLYLSCITCPPELHLCSVLRVCSVPLLDRYILYWTCICSNIATSALCLWRKKEVFVFFKHTILLDYTAHKSLNLSSEAKIFHP